MSADLLLQALGLAAVGMVTVFGLLAALTAAVLVMSRLIDPRRPAVQTGESPDDADSQAETAAAVAAALRHHRAAAGAGTGR